MADKREDALAKRHVRMENWLQRGTKQLKALKVGDSVSIQDQTGNTPKRWSKTGKVIECPEHDSYLVKIDGSNKVTKRNRQFLRRLEPFKVDEDTPISEPIQTVCDHIDGEENHSNDNLVRRSTREKRISSRLNDFVIDFNSLDASLPAK